MFLFLISLVLMTLAIAIAVVPMTVTSVREHRRERDRAYAAGTLPAPADGAARIALLARPGVRPAQLAGAFSDSNARSDGPLFTGTSVRRTAGDRRVLVTVPGEALETRHDIVPEIEQHLRRTDLFEEVRVLEAA